MQNSPLTVQRLADVLSPKSKWSAETVADFLEDSRLPVRIATINSAGYPQTTSLWFSFPGGRFICCTQPGALICAHVRVNPKVGFEVAVNEPPYYGVSGQGDAQIVPGNAAALLKQLTDRYLAGRDAALKAWLLSRAANEVIIEVTPKRVTSWDFRGRMTPP